VLEFILGQNLALRDALARTPPASPLDLGPCRRSARKAGPSGRRPAAPGFLTGFVVPLSDPAAGIWADAGK
jgi:hypothetical protein